MTMSGSNVALGGCVISVLLGVFVILRGYDPYKTAQHVGFAWLMIWTWLGKRFGLFGMRTKQIYETFKKESKLCNCPLIKLFSGVLWCSR
jgi:hypothetical protein